MVAIEQKIRDNSSFCAAFIFYYVKGMVGVLKVVVKPPISNKLYFFNIPKEHEIDKFRLLPFLMESNDLKAR